MFLVETSKLSTTCGKTTLKSTLMVLTEFNMHEKIGLRQVISLRCQKKIKMNGSKLFVDDSQNVTFKRYFPKGSIIPKIFEVRL